MCTISQPTLLIPLPRLKAFFRFIFCLPPTKIRHILTSPPAINFKESIPNSFNSKRKTIGEVHSKFFNRNAENQEDLINNYWNCISDQKSCRLYQNIIKASVNFVNNDLFHIFLDNFVETTMHQYANFFASVIVELLEKEKIKTVLKKAKQHFREICKVKQGSHVLQTLIKRLIYFDLEDQVPYLLADNVDLVFTNQAAKFVGVLVVREVNLSFNRFIFDFIENNPLEVKTAQFGCEVIRECLSRDPSIEYILLVTIEKNFEIIVNNQRSSFLLQFLIDTTREKAIKMIVGLLIKKLGEYCCGKYSSQVVEKVSC